MTSRMNPSAPLEAAASGSKEATPQPARGHRRPRSEQPDAAASPQRSLQLAGAATRTPRSHHDESQDRVGTDSTVTVVADGVGSLPDSGPAAELTVDTVLEALRAGATCDHAVEAAHAAVQELVGPTGCATVLVARYLDGAAAVHWAGNGAVFLASPSEDLATGQLHAHLTPLTLPHVVYRAGLDLLDDAVGGTHPPRLDSLTLAESHRWRLLLSVTDGLYSVEQRRIGNTTDGTSWTLRPPAVIGLERLAVDLFRLVLTGQSPPLGRSGYLGPCSEPNGAPATWTQLLENYLEELLRDGELEDDASIAALLIPPAR